MGCGRRLRLKRLDPGIQSRLVTGSLVLLDDAVRDRTINDRHSALVGGCCRLIVAAVDSCDGLFNRRTERRTLAGIMSAARLVLSGAFSCLG